MHFSPKTVRILRRALLTLATLVTVLAAVITFENWRGARAWRLYREAAAARGDPIDRFPSPSPLRPERNFYATPFLARSILQPGEALADDAKALLAQGKALHFTLGGANPWRSGRPVDWAELRGSWAKGVAKASARSEPSLPDDPTAVLRQGAGGRILGELRAAATARPESELIRPPWRPGEDVAARPIPRFELARAVATALMLDAQLALMERRTDDAFAGTLAGLQFTRGLLTERDTCLVDTMIGCVLFGRALQPLWEGLYQRAWSEAQLAEFDRVLADCPALAALEHSVRRERTFVALVEFRTAGDSEVALRWLRWFPGGRDQNRLAACVAVEPQIAALAARETDDFLPALARRERETEALLAGWSPYRTLARFATPAYGKVTERSAETEAFARLARTAVALARFRLMHGASPVTLGALCPEFLSTVPRDPIDGQPLRYRLNDDGTFVLYSVGMDGRDDRGAPAKKSRGEGEAFTGDWNWPQLSSAAVAKP